MPPEKASPVCKALSNAGREPVNFLEKDEDPFRRLWNLMFWKKKREDQTDLPIPERRTTGPFLPMSSVCPLA